MHRTVSLRALLLAALALSLIALGAACADDEDTPEDPEVPGATATPTEEPADGTPAVTTSPSPTAQGTGTAVAEDGRTGVDELDEIVVAVEEGDVAALMERTLVQSVPCTTEQGAGGPPKCDEGDEQSTPYDVFPVVGCEGGWTDDPEGLWSRLIRESRGLYAATEAGFETAEWPQSEWFLVFHREYVDGDAGARLHVDANGWIVAYWEGCQATVEDLVQFDEQDLELIAGPFEPA